MSDAVKGQSIYGPVAAGAMQSSRVLIWQSRNAERGKDLRLVHIRACQIQYVKSTRTTRPLQNLFDSQTLAPTIPRLIIRTALPLSYRTTIHKHDTMAQGSNDGVLSPFFKIPRELRDRVYVKLAKTDAVDVEQGGSDVSVCN